MKIEKGQVWKNKKTGDPRLILRAPDENTLRWVVHKGKRRAESQESSFRRKYEYSHDAPEGATE